MKTLFNIQAEHLQLMEALEDAEGLLTPELEEALEINKAELEKKAEGYIHIIKEFEAKINLANDEIKRLQALKKAATNAQDRLKESLFNALMQYGVIDKKGVKRLEIGTNKLSTRKSVQVNIIDSAVIPEDFAKWEKTVNKTAIKEALKNGGKVEGAELIENLNLSIR